MVRGVIRTRWTALRKLALRPDWTPVTDKLRIALAVYTGHDDGLVTPASHPRRIVPEHRAGLSSTRLGCSYPLFARAFGGGRCTCGPAGSRYSRAYQETRAQCRYLSGAELEWRGAVEAVHPTTTPRCIAVHANIRHVGERNRTPHQVSTSPRAWRSFAPNAIPEDTRQGNSSTLQISPSTT